MARFLKGLPIAGPKITHRYDPSAEVQQVILSPKRVDLQTKIQLLLDRREGFITAQDRAAYERGIQHAIDEVHQVGNNLNTLQDAPYQMIAPNPKRRLKMKKTTLNTRALTANELATAQAKQAQKEATIVARDAEIDTRREQQLGQLQAAVTITPPPPIATPIVTTRPESPTLIPQTPPHRSALPPAAEPPLAFDLPPASTAPPAITEGLGRRKRAGTGFYADLQKGNSQGARAKKAK